MVNDPREVYKIVNAEHAFTIRSALTGIPESSAKAPLRMHEDNMSRYIMQISSCGENAKNCVIANIPAESIAAIYLKTQTAMVLKEEFKSQADKYTEQPDCYKAEIPFGKYKGRSPADILSNDPKAKTEIIKISDYLNSNIDKYPGNIKLVNAISETLALFESGNLHPNTITTQYPLYCQQYRTTSIQNSRNEYLAYCVSLDCLYKHYEHPWMLSIENAYLKTKSDKWSDASGLTSNIFSFTDDEWLTVIDKAYSITKMWESSVFPEMFERSQKYQYRNDATKHQET